MRAHELIDQVESAMRYGPGSGKGGEEVMVMVDGQVMPVADVRYHEGHECFVVEADLT